jgi:phage gp45-like
MMEALREAARQIAAVVVTRGKVRRARLGPQRTVLQVTVLKGEVKEGVELLLPPGMSAVPLAGDALLFQVNGRRDHLVALVDDPSTRIADLKAGEFGFRDQLGQQVVFRADHLEITTPRKVVLTAGGDVVINTTGNVVLTPGGTIQLGGTGGRRIVLDGDPVTGGSVRATSSKILGQ